MPRASKRVPMAPWTFRITTDYENIQPIVELITDKELTSGTYVLGYETTSRDGSPAEPHFHGYFESIMTQQQIRDSIRALGHSGKYSISPPKSGLFMCPTACAYCIKYGKYQTANISQELIDEWVSANERQVAEFKQARKLKKEKSKSVLKCIEEQFGYESVPPGSPHQIIDDILTYYQESGTLVREFAIISQVQTLTLKYIPEYKALLKDRVFEKIFGQSRPAPPDNGLLAFLDKISFSNANERSV